MRSARVPFAAVLLVLGAAGPALAGTVFVNGSLTAADPTFSRPLDNGSSAPIVVSPLSFFYDAYPFTVSVTGAYVLETTGAVLAPGNPDDTFLVLYQTAFNPATPLVNALEADDDDGTGALSRIPRTLTSGTQYFAVVTTFTSGAQGIYTLQISGPGDIAGAGLTVVPEPGTYALFGLGLAGLGGIVLRRRRKGAAAVPARA